MTIEQALRALAGVIILITTLLGAFVSPWWLLMTGFVGANLLQSAFTNTCPAVWIFSKLGLKRCTAEQPAAQN